MSYINGDVGSPIEPTFEFPLKDDGKFSVNYLSAVIGDEMIEAQIGQNEEAKLKYDNDILRGKTAFRAE